MARVVAIVSDLMLASRVTTSLARPATRSSRSSSIPAELDGADLVVADLDTVDPEELAGAGVPAIGFYSHVDVDTKARADDAGIAMAVPRSRMARELPDLVERVLRRLGAGDRRGPAHAPSRSSRNPSSTSAGPRLGAGQHAVRLGPAQPALTAREIQCDGRPGALDLGRERAGGHAAPRAGRSASRVRLGHLGGEVLDRGGRVLLEHLVSALEPDQEPAEDRVLLGPPRRRSRRPARRGRARDTGARRARRRGTRGSGSPAGAAGRPPRSRRRSPRRRCPKPAARRPGTRWSGSRRRRGRGRRPPAPSGAPRRRRGPP